MSAPAPQPKHVSEMSENDLIHEGQCHTKQVVRESGLSDRDYMSEELDSGCDSGEELFSGSKFPTFRMLKKMADYK